MPPPSADASESPDTELPSQVPGTRVSALRERQVQDRRRRWNVVGVVGELLMTAGVFLLLFVAWQLWWTDVEAARTSSQTVTRLKEDFERPSATTLPDPMAPGGVIEGKAFALLHVPRLGSEWVEPILEGTGLDILAGGIGHYADTAMPGEVGNFAVAGHRTTWGRPFHDIETLAVGDAVVVETRTAWHVYAVSSSEIVAPTAMEVIAPVPDRPDETPTQGMLTITTCHPKYSAEQRYVVHAQLVETRPREQGLPESVLTTPQLKVPVPAGSGAPAPSPGSPSGAGSPSVSSSAAPSPPASSPSATAGGQ